MPTVFVQRPTATSLQEQGSIQRFLMTWAPAIAGMAVIAIESTSTFSASHTGRWLRLIVEAIYGRITSQDTEEINHILRKSGHFSFYGLLCVLFVRSWLLTLGRDSTLSDTVWRWRSWAMGLASTFLIASADELHQSFLPSRTGLFSDVILDTCGGLVVSSAVMAISWRIRCSRERPPRPPAYLQA